MVSTKDYIKQTHFVFLSYAYRVKEDEISIPSDWKIVEAIWTSPAEALTFNLLDNIPSFIQLLIEKGILVKE